MAENKGGKVGITLAVGQSVEIGLGLRERITLRIEYAEGGVMTAPRIEITGCTFGNCVEAPITMAIDGGRAADVMGEMQVIDPIGEYETLRAAAYGKRLQWGKVEREETLRGEVQRRAWEARSGDL